VNFILLKLKMQQPVSYLQWDTTLQQKILL